jgi:hypothetical protein
VPHGQRESLMQVGGDIPDLLRLPGPGILLPAVGDAPEQGHERGRRRDQHPVTDRIVEQARMLTVGGGQQILGGHEAHGEVDRALDLARVVALGERAHVPGDRLGVGREGLAPLVLAGRRRGALEVVERELGVDDEPAASRQLQHHVGPGSLGRDLELEIPVPIHSRRFQEVLQHELAGPAPLRGVREDRAEALHLSQRVVEPGLDLALGL